MAAPMFAVIVAGRLVQTDFQPLDTTKFVTNIVDADNVNHIVVFLTGAQPFPDGLGGSVEPRVRIGEGLDFANPVRNKGFPSMVWTFNPMIFLTSFAKRAVSRAPISSNLGRDNLFRGATRLLDVTRSTLTLSLCLTLKKAAAPYAFDWHRKRYGFGLHLNLHWNRGSFVESSTLIKMEVLTTIVTILHEYLAVACHPRITSVAKVLVIGI
ncbi:hypothetical protein TNCV_2346671 [Trichonephila clavipes]|nr:hypothetical protein TNCV_2346671 [Trichonephila clavipes]